MKVLFNTRLKYILPSLLWSITQFLHAEVGTITEIVRAQAHCPVILHASDFGTTGTVINQPGYYKLCDNVEFTSGSVTAIAIQSSYVTVDMNTKSIFGAGLDVGITLTSSIHDVVIKDGILSEFGSYGIFVDQGCHKIFFENLNLNHATCSSALAFNGTLANPVHECSIDYCKINEITSQVVVDLNYCDDMQIMGSSFNNNGGSANLSVVDLNLCDKCRFIKCHFNDNVAEGRGVLSCITTTTSSSLEIEGCSFKNNRLSDGELRCIYLDGSQGSLVKTSIFANNRSSSLTASAAGLCIALDDRNSMGDKIYSSIITNNSVTTTINSTDAQMYGIRVTGTDAQQCYVEQCLITKNSATASGSSSNALCYALVLDNGVYHYVSDCAILSNYASGTGTSVGSGLYNSSSSPVIKNSSFFGNSHYGIYNASDAIVVACNSGYNGTNYGGIPWVIPNSTDVVKLGDNITHIQKFENFNIWVD